MIDAYSVAREAGMGRRMNTIMQTCFFAISGVLPRDEAIDQDQEGDRENLWQARGSGAKNFAAVDAALAHLHRGQCQHSRAPAFDILRRVPARGAEFRHATCSATMSAGRGDLLPVSALPPDGTFPTGTAQWEKRNIAQEIPVWDKRSASSAASAPGLPACRDPRQGLRRRETGGAPAPSRPQRRRWRGHEDDSIPCKSRPKTARAAALCVAVCPRSRTRATQSIKPLIWSRRPHCASPKARTGVLPDLPSIDRTRLRIDR